MSVMGTLWFNLLHQMLWRFFIFKGEINNDSRMIKNLSLIALI